MVDRGNGGPREWRAGTSLSARNVRDRT